jgi:NAD(P)-dependent dehydrogenase (short-subunit alcohol dehydrogenase family)
MRIFITGSNRGLGLEFTRQLVARGDRVFATCRKPSAADELGALQAAQPDRLSVTPLDVTDPDSIDASYRTIRAETGALDVLINNAAISGSGQRMGELTKETIMRMMAVNVAGPMLIVQRYLDLMRKGDHPKIVNITSGVGSMTGYNQRGLYPYGASKAALNRFTRALMLDVKRDGIITIVMDPGWVKTDMGGPGAAITPEKSIAGMLDVIDNLTMDDTGEFFHYQGGKVPW